MKTDHLSAWEQEEYILNQGTEQQSPQVLRHLAECAACRAEVARLEHGMAIFRSAAVEWSAQCLATRPQQLQSVPLRRLSYHRHAMGFCRCRSRGPALACAASVASLSSLPDRK